MAAYELSDYLKCEGYNFAKAKGIDSAYTEEIRHYTEKKKEEFKEYLAAEGVARMVTEIGLHKLGVSADDIIQRPLLERWDVDYYSGGTLNKMEAKMRKYAYTEDDSEKWPAVSPSEIKFGKDRMVFMYFIPYDEYMIFDLSSYSPGLSKKLYKHLDKSCVGCEKWIWEHYLLFDPAKAIFRGKLGIKNIWER